MDKFCAKYVNYFAKNFDTNAKKMDDFDNLDSQFVMNVVKKNIDQNKNNDKILFF